MGAPGSVAVAHFVLGFAAFGIACVVVIGLLVQAAMSGPKKPDVADDPSDEEGLGGI